MMRLPELIEFGEREDLPVVTIAALIEYLQEWHCDTDVPMSVPIPESSRVIFEVETQVPTEHGSFRFRAYRDDHGGVVIPPEGFVRLFGSPQQLKRPDTGFVLAGRLPGDDLGDGYLDIPADVIVEVVSPRDGAETVELKVRAYLAAGVRVVWLVYPKARTVHVRAIGVSRVIEGDEVLATEDVLPGFSVRVSELLGAR